MGKNLTSVKIGGIPPDIKPEWLLVATLANTEGLYNVVPVRPKP